MSMKDIWALSVIASILLIGTFGLQYGYAETLIIEQGATVTIEPGATMIVESDDVPNMVTNQGTLNVENTGKLVIEGEGAFLNDFTGISNLASGGEVDIGSLNSTLSSLINFGELNGPGQINFLGNTVIVTNCAILTVILNSLTTIQEMNNPCLVIGGTFIPIDKTALLLAGVQSVSMWMIPVVLAGIGIGVFVIKRRK